MGRFLNSKTLKDKIESKVLLKNINMLSVNQLNAKIKLLEVWKSLNVDNYPLKIATKVQNNNTTNTRSMTTNQPLEIGTSVLTQRSCISDAIKLWNHAPLELRSVAILYAMKKYILTSTCMLSLIPQDQIVNEVNIGILSIY